MGGGILSGSKRGSVNLRKRVFSTEILGLAAGSEIFRSKGVVYVQKIHKNNEKFEFLGGSGG